MPAVSSYQPSNTQRNCVLIHKGTTCRVAIDACWRRVDDLSHCLAEGDVSASAFAHSVLSIDGSILWDDTRGEERFHGYTNQNGMAWRLCYFYSNSWYAGSMSMVAPPSNAEMPTEFFFSLAFSFWLFQARPFIFEKSTFSAFNVQPPGYTLDIPRNHNRNVSSWLITHHVLLQLVRLTFS